MEKIDLPDNLREANGTEIQNLLNQIGKVESRQVNFPASLLINQNWNVSLCYFKELNPTIVHGGMLIIENCYIDLLNVNMNPGAVLLMQKSKIEKLKINGATPNSVNYSVNVESESRILEFMLEGGGNGTVSFDSTQIDKISYLTSTQGSHRINIHNCKIESDSFNSIYIKGQNQTLNINGKSIINGGILIESSNNAHLEINDSVVNNLVRVQDGANNSIQLINSM